LEAINVGTSFINERTFAAVKSDGSVVTWKEEVEMRVQLIGKPMEDYWGLGPR